MIVNRAKRISNKKMTLIATEINKRHDKIIKISENIYQGYRYFDIREYYLDENNEFQPSKKGITFSPDLLGKVIDGLRILEDKKR